MLLPLMIGRPSPLVIPPYDEAAAKRYGPVLLLGLEATTAWLLIYLLLFATTPFELCYCKRNIWSLRLGLNGVHPILRYSSSWLAKLYGSERA